MISVFASELRWILMIACLAIFVFAFGMMLVIAYNQHRKGGTEAGNFHGSVVVEICWALAPLFIVMQIVWSAVRNVLQP